MSEILKNANLIIPPRKEFTILTLKKRTIEKGLSTQQSDSEKIPKNKRPVTRKGEFVDYQICSLCNNILQIIIKMTLGRPRDNDGVLSWKDFSNALLNPDNTSLGTLCFHEVDRLLDIMSAYNKLQSSKKKEKNSEDCDTYRISNKDLYDEAVSKLQEIAPDNIQDDKYGLKNYFHKYKIANQIKNLIKSIHNEDKIESVSNNLPPKINPEKHKKFLTHCNGLKIDSLLAKVT